MICVQELEESIIHRITKLSDFYYTRKNGRKKSRLVDDDFETCLASCAVESRYFERSGETKNSSKKPLESKSKGNEPSWN